MYRRLHLLLSALVAIMAIGAWMIRVEPHPAPILETPIATSTPVSSIATSTIQTNAFVVRVVDGDTIVVKQDTEPGEWTVRLLGVNTPETMHPTKPVECFGKEASAYTKRMLTNQRVRLEADPQADDQDKYQRLLRNVFLADGTDFDARLVQDGYAYAYLSFPLNPVRKKQLRTLEQDARVAQRGLWSTETCNGTL